MSHTVIKVENISKQYRLGVLSRKTLTHDLQSWWARKRGKDDPNAKLHQLTVAQRNSEERIWALKDVSFEVKDGEVLGIIGKNGAGKSTLLKILSRVTAPSSGYVKVKGRVASLLEVGTGFHPELTGRENIYLNGAILGMKREEIAQKFDEIVDFAGVDKFIDTPVKRYSSGMHVRLAFAVAAHLDPEILVVDEVLAVGDAEFQKKCLGKMGEVAREGRTVLFVSHNMGAISQLTERGLVLQDGCLAYWGSTSQALHRYAKSFEKKTQNGFNPRERSGNGLSEVNNVFISDVHEQETNIVEFNQPFNVSIDYKTSRKNGVLAGFTIVSSFGMEVLTSHSDDVFPLVIRNSGRITCLVAPNCLSPGHYYLRIALFDPTYAMDDRIERALDFEVVISEGMYSSMVDKRPGLLRLPLSWKCTEGFQIHKAEIK